MDGVDQGLPGLCDEGAVQERAGDPVVDVRGQQGVVVLGQHVEGAGRTGSDTRDEACRAGPGTGDGPHRDDRGGQPGRDLAQHLRVACAAAVDLVDEQQRRDAQPLQRPHQHPRLRLDALHRGDHEDGAVQHAEDPLHLGDEIRVTGGVDEVDGDAVERERDDGGLDGDATLPFQREGVGAGVPVVDAADLVDHPGRMEQPLGQAGLTGVDMGENPEVEHVHEASCPSRREPLLTGGDMNAVRIRLSSGLHDVADPSSAADGPCGPQRN